jgi:glycosyltransferase involved in cell wall biosynthesis
LNTYQSNKGQVIYHFSVYKEGGVHAVIKNIIKGSSYYNLKYRIIYFKNKESESILEEFQQCETSVISYSKYDNLYKIANKVNKKLKGSNIVLACHDWLELSIITLLGLNYPVVFFLHGDYEFYYNSAVKNERYISRFIVPTKSIKIKLIELIPHRELDILMISFPVPVLRIPKLSYSKISCAYYVADLCDQNKNFDFIPKLDDMLLSNGLSINWNIAGGGMSMTQFTNCWRRYDSSRIKYFGYISQNELTKYLSQSNIFILPSYVEGLPISLVQSMRVGLVPIVNNWSDSILEYIEHEKNGFIVNNCDIKAFGDIIIYLSNNIQYLKSCSDNAKSSVAQKNSEIQSCVLIEQTFHSLKNVVIKNIPKKNYGSRLDSPFIPNIFTFILRKMIKKISG